MITASIAESARHLSSASLITSHICVVSAWIALGRLSRSRPTAPSVVMMTSSLISPLPMGEGGSRRRRRKGEVVECLPHPTLSRGERAYSLAQQVPADDHPHHLVGALEDRVDPKVAPEALDRIVHQIAVAAVQLKRAIDDR